jgi:hypothetical protein
VELSGYAAETLRIREVISYTFLIAYSFSSKVSFR